MANFGDILNDWETQKKAEPKKSTLPQGGQAWRNKKTEPVKKSESSQKHSGNERTADKENTGKNSVNGISQRNPMNERSIDASPLKRNPMNERSMDASPLKRNPMNVWLQRYGVIDKDKASEKEMEQDRARESIKQMLCEASLDLHGLTREEACIRMNAFITECERRNLHKVLIIHGKGNHSEDEPVLRQAVRSFIENDKRLGQFGFADKTLGGRGATWVLIREKTDK